MEPNLYHLRLPVDLARAAQRLAARRGTTVGQILRDLLAAEVAEAAHEQTDPACNAAEQMQLSKLFDGARDWMDLIGKLKAQDLTLRPAGNGLALHQVQTDERVIKTTDIGQPYQALVKRFGAPFPNHPHAWMAQRVLQTKTTPQKRLNHVLNDAIGAPAPRRDPAERV